MQRHGDRYGVVPFMACMPLRPVKCSCKQEMAVASLVLYVGLFICMTAAI